MKYNANFAANIKDIIRQYLSWSKRVKDAKRKQAGQEMQHRVETTKERLNRKIRERVSQAEEAVQKEWQAIQQPTNDDERRLLPTTRAAHLAKSTCGQDVKLSRDAQTALELLAQNFVDETVGFAVAMSRRRPRSSKQNSEIKASDASLFMSTAYNILLPMTGEREVRGYTVTTSLPKAKAAREVVAAARRENLRDQGGRGATGK